MIRAEQQQKSIIVCRCDRQKVTQLVWRARLANKEEEGKEEAGAAGERAAEMLRTKRTREEALRERKSDRESEQQLSLCF